MRNAARARPSHSRSSTRVSPPRIARGTPPPHASRTRRLGRLRPARVAWDRAQRPGALPRLDRPVAAHRRGPHHHRRLFRNLVGIRPRSHDEAAAGTRVEFLQPLPRPLADPHPLARPLRAKARRCARRPHRHPWEHGPRMGSLDDRRFALPQARVEDRPVVALPHGDRYLPHARARRRFWAAWLPREPANVGPHHRRCNRELKRPHGDLQPGYPQSEGLRAGRPVAEPSTPVR